MNGCCLDIGFVLKNHAVCFCRLLKLISFLAEGVRQERLLFWIQEQIPHLAVTDLSLAWCDGVALCALLEALYPGSCPRYDLLKPQNKVNNCRLALKLASKYANTPMVRSLAERQIGLIVCAGFW